LFETVFYHEKCEMGMIPLSFVSTKTEKATCEW